MQRVTRLGYHGSRLGLVCSKGTQQQLQISQPLFSRQIRRVSQQCFDVFGFVKDGTDLAKRDSTAWIFWHWPKLWRFGIVFMQFGPATFILWSHGVFDYLIRRRNIKPLEPDWDAEFPYRPPEGYENPLFEPARKYAKLLAKKKERKDQVLANINEGLREKGYQFGPKGYTKIPTDESAL